MSVERPCPNEIVTFTCTVVGKSLRWELSDVNRITVRTSTSLNVPTMPRPGYTVTLTEFSDTIMTTMLSRTAEEGITVSCEDPLPTLTIVGSTTISLVGEVVVYLYY